MMPNIFDQFDATPAAMQRPLGNAFDQFDPPQSAQPKAPQFDDLSWTPPGVVVHGAAGDYMSDRPDMTARRPVSVISTPEQEYAQQIEQHALQRRYTTKFDDNNVRAWLPFYQGGTLNFGDEAVSALRGATEALKGGDFQREYDTVQAAQKQALDRERMEHRVRSTVTQLAGAGVTGLATGGAGWTATSGAMGKGLLPMMGAGAIDGSVMGGIAGAGEGDGLADRLKGGAKGAVLGGLVGTAIPPLVAGSSKVLRALLSRITSGGAADVADREVLQAVQRSGKTPEEIAMDILESKKDGQDPFALVDAIGQPGQRLLSTAARTPNDDRAALIEWLNERQAGQGRRVAGALQDASGTQETAQQLATRLTAERDAAANADYGALRQATADQPIWSQELQDLTSRPSVRKAIGDARGIGAERGYEVTNPFKAAEDGTLTLPQGTAPNFQFWDTIKRGIDRQIAADPTNRDLTATKNALTEILDKQVEGYAAARAPFRAKSQAIEAIDAGKAATMRGRVEDTIPAFQGLKPDQQAGFRAGYFDPLIADAQKAAEGVNKVRPLLTDATKAEFPAFAAPGTADQLAARLGREKTMFETRAEATGGSKTADNIADQSAFGAADFAPIAKLLAGRPGEAMKALGPRIINELQGLSPTALAKVSEALRGRDPSAVAGMLQRAGDSQATSRARQAVIAAIMNQAQAEDNPLKLLREPLRQLSR